ncbi:outer membrane protein assembly factor BamE [Deltaproteobacteria bacterium]|nr:outer membrane protein assembly factor BamE [Deltaproteobacteria bacterium]
MKNYTFMIIAIIIAGALTFFTFFPQAITAQDDDILQLHQKISDLEDRIKYLETLLIAPDESEISLNEAGQGWQNKKNWRNLKTGMTLEEVRNILGNPIKTINGVKTLWYYPNIYCGYVSFDEEGSLTTWNEP